MREFDKLCNSILEAYTFGATAYGNADIDKTTAMEIEQGKIQPNWQYLGTKNNKLIPNFSVASNKLPHGTLVKIKDRVTGKPIGSEFGNPNGIFRVDDKGGSSVYNNIDFYSGSNKNLYDYFAGLGKDSNNLVVEPLNIEKGSEEEKQLLASIKTPSGGETSQGAEGEYEYDSAASKALAGLKSQAMGILSGKLEAPNARQALAQTVGTTLGAIKGLKT